MSILEVCIWLLVLVASTKAIGFRDFAYSELKEPKVSDEKSSNISLKWIQQPLDHFNTRDNRQWRMRYYENYEFFNGTGPMLIFLGGEWAISPAYLSSGLIYEIAESNGAMMYYTEHRYYGNSLPTSDTSVENLQYLSVDQALADVAYFIETKKKEVAGFFNTGVIVIGGSYAGNMAAWARLKYPHLIQGALASSAPVRAKANFFEYHEVATASLGRYHQQCVDNLKNAFDTIQLLLGTTDGPDYLKKIFNLCKTPKITSPSSLPHFMNELAEKVVLLVQGNSMIGKNVSYISEFCDKMMNTTMGTPIMRFANSFSSDDCKDLSYEGYIEKHGNTSWASTANSFPLRIWLYQTCTEFGYFSTSSADSIFGDLIPLSFFTQMCSDLFGSYYDLNLLDSGIRRTNRMYGGSLPDVTNVIFTNGNLDPWHALSVLEDLNDKSPAILMDGASHIQDTSSDRPFDPPALIEGRKRVRSIINGWLNSS